MSAARHSTDSSDDTQPPYNPRHRLVGALVLLALAVIFLPVVLDFRGEFEERMDADAIPPKPDDFKVEILPLEPPPEATVPPPAPALARKPSQGPAAGSGAVADTAGAPSREEKAAAAATVENKTAAPRPATAEESPVITQVETPAETPAEIPARPAAKTPATQAATREVPPRPAPQRSGNAKQERPQVAGPPPRLKAGWVVQVGSFSSRRNARRLRDRLDKAGFESFLGEFRMDGRPAYRVLVGPVARQGEAEALRTRLGKQAGVKGIVMRYRQGD